MGEVKQETKHNKPIFSFSRSTSDYSHSASFSQSHSRSSFRGQGDKKCHHNPPEGFVVAIGSDGQCQTVTPPEGRLLLYNRVWLPINAIPDLCIF